MVTGCAEEITINRRSCYGIVHEQENIGNIARRGETESGKPNVWTNLASTGARKVEGLGVLIYSKAYEYNEITPLHILAWSLQCLERSEDFKLKSVDIEHVQPTLDLNNKKEEESLKPQVNLVKPRRHLSSSDDKTVKGISSSDCSIPSSDEQVATSREKNQDPSSNIDSINDPPPASITPSELGSGDEGDIALKSKGKGVEMGDMNGFQHSRSTRITRRTTRGFSHDVSKLASSSAEGSTSRLKTTQEREKTTLDSMGPGRSKTYRKKDVSQHAKSEKVVGKQKESQRRSKKSYEGGDSGEEAGDEENILVGEAGSAKSFLSKKKMDKAMGDKK
ncbi:hypothetical protein PNOK_0273400 [Pyrrhoderma noxium]|uniref:Uncharacterized protein n=1 Tax=Pyrrhoderma noxium TaxID=2282107 RepID=A0A286UT83_9AGAM|nr:hypothetical protein PNOK_0273400 [Pyrrhoderma noxium]